MGKYVDGFVLVVPEDKTEEYKEMAQQGRDDWMKHGALAVYECKGDDMSQMDFGGEKTRGFPEMTGAAEGETVWFSFIIFRDKAHRDEVNAKVMKEMEEQGGPEAMSAMPFEMKRMAYGGFEALVES